jgi:ATP-binding cassette subfamily B protein
MAQRGRRRWLAPEVVQTSAMDCGPAALKCLLAGFGLEASYGRLREACQTDVDGTSIDTLEEIAVQLGLDAEQMIVPAEHLFAGTTDSLPALVVVTLPSGVTHFVVVWRRHGPLFQVMDPATGRRWLSRKQLLDELYLHEMSLPADAWREWAGTNGFLDVLRERMNRLGVGRRSQEEWIEAAVNDSTWQSLARLDAAVRLVNSIAERNGLRRGAETARVVDGLVAARDDEGGHRGIPDEFRSARSADDDTEGKDQVTVRGAVLVRVRGPRKGEPAQQAPPLPADLAAALDEPPSRPGRELLHLLRTDGLLSPLALVAALALSAATVLIEALLFRGLLHVSRDLGLMGQRLGAISAMVVFLLALLALEVPIVTGLLRLGRKLEVQLRMAFLQKIPRLKDRYFHSRLNSDMAERAHSIHQVRHLPEVGGQFLRSVIELGLTAAAIAWLSPASAPLAALAAVAALALPLLVQPVVWERDLRLRTHTGALSRFYFDALQGLTAIRAHGAERAVRREHEGLLREWVAAGLGLQRAAVVVEGLQFVVGFGLAAWLLLDHLDRAGESATVLLLVYWALRLPVLGQEVGMMARRYPEHRNLTLRLLEPLGAREESEEPAGDDPERGPATEPIGGAAVAIAFENLTVRAGGHTILDGIRLSIAAGEHVAIVGSSGAGKSTLVGSLLGWHGAATGCVRVDGAPLDGAMLGSLRRATAWVDPGVYLWNQTLLDNLRYGAPGDSDERIGTVIDAADLREVLERMPDGLQTPLGEGGALVSGGEGQRVRLGRSLHRRGTRLAILDEPFRGLDRDKRRSLLARSRAWWKDATLLCITHDVGDTMLFDRVLVVERGRLVEDGAPRMLAEQEGSCYRSLLDAEAALREGLWSASDWRRLCLDDGRLAEEGS